MAKSAFRTDRYREQLFFRGEGVPTEDGETFDLLASKVANVRLSELPLGVKVRLCDRVIGSRDLYPRTPDAAFEKSRKTGLVVHASTPILPPTEDSPAEALQQYFEDSLMAAERSLELLRAAGRIVATERSIYEEIAYLSYTVTLCDQTFSEAEAFALQIDDLVSTAHGLPSLFVCHASEDKPFVDRLVAELDRRAMFAWYDKREIFVGDSVVEKVNHALKAADFLVAVLSPRSVSKPWVTREMNSSLMRQLASGGIRILPVLFEPCEVPSLLADLKYADFTRSFDSGLNDLLMAIRRHQSTSSTKR